MKKLSFVFILISIAILSCNDQTETIETITEEITIDDSNTEVEPVEEIGVDDLLEQEINFTEFKNDGKKVGFKYPSDWTSDEQEMRGMYYYEVVDNATGVNFNFTIGSDQGAKLSDWKTMITEEITKDGSEILNSSTIQVCNSDCIFTSVRRKHDNGDIIQNSYVLLKNGHAYMMNFTCPEIIYKASKDIEDYIIGSVNID